MILYPKFKALALKPNPAHYYIFQKYIKGLTDGDQFVAVSSFLASLSCHGWVFSIERMRASCFRLRGLMDVLNGAGWLTTPGRKFTSGSTSRPFSTTLLMLKTARDCTTLRYTVLSARMRPGQMRRPKPKESLWGSGSGVWLSVARKRSGLNAIGSWYTVGSWANPLNKS